MRNTIRILALLLAATASIPAATVVISHPDVTDASISSDAIKKIYLGKQSSWEDGTRVSLVVLDSDHGHAFLKEHVRKSFRQFVAYWKRQVFTGKGSMPAISEKDEAVVSVVQSTPGAIGFVDESALTDAVRQVPLE